MITAKLNLQALKGAQIIEGQNGKKGLLIPVDGNLFIGQKGTYLDIVAFRNSNSQFGDTHVVSQSISKERREAGETTEILGNLTDTDKQAKYPQGGQPQMAPQGQPQMAPQGQPQGDFVPNKDGMPF